MQTADLPETVIQALGTEAAKDLEVWLEERLRTAQFSSEVQVSAFVARQKVNVLILERVSNLLLSGDPRLVQGSDESWLWRVPVDLTFPTHGRVGCVGKVDVDARYGKVYYDDMLLSRISDEAQRLTQQFLSSAK